MLAEEEFETAWRAAGVAEFPACRLPPDAVHDASLQRSWQLVEQHLEGASNCADGDGVESTLAALQRAFLEYEAQLKALEAQTLGSITDDEPLMATLQSNLEACAISFTELESSLEASATEVERLARDIRQHESTARTDEQQLQTRRVAAAHLAAFASELVVDPAHVEALRAPRVIDETYLGHVVQLRKKIEFASLEDARRTAAYQQVAPLLYRLLQEVVRRLREFLLDKLAMLLEPNTNVQILQQNVLIKYAYFVEFLQDMAPSVFDEVQNAYVATMGRVYLGLFRRYVSGLLALQEPDPTGGETIVTPAMYATGSLSFLSSWLPSASSLLPVGGLARTSTPAEQDAGPGQSVGRGFALADRLDILQRYNAPSSILAVVMDQRQPLPAEEIFRSVGKMFIEACTTEYAFCTRYFGSVRDEVFERIFEPVKQFIIDQFAAYAHGTGDALGLLTCIRVVQRQRALVRQRGVLVMESYFSRVELTAVPRLKHLLQAQEQSLQDAQPHAMFEVAVAAARADVTQPEQLLEGVCGPHEAVRRYAGWTAALLALLQPEPHPEVMVRQPLDRMRRHLERILHQMAERFPTPRTRLVFLIQNMDLILERLQASAQQAGVTVQPVPVDQDADEWSDLAAALAPQRDACTEQFAEMELRRQFADLMALRHRADAPDEHRLRLVLEEFRVNWRDGLERLEQSVRRCFVVSSAATRVLQSVFTLLMRLCHALDVQVVTPRYPSLRTLLVDEAALEYEVRRLNGKTAATS